MKGSILPHISIPYLSGTIQHLVFNTLPHHREHQ